LGLLNYKLAFSSAIYENKHCYNNGTFIFSEPFFKVMAHFINVKDFEVVLPQMFQVGIHCYQVGLRKHQGLKKNQLYFL
jgi:hypothetical protein